MHEPDGTTCHGPCVRTARARSPRRLCIRWPAKKRQKSNLTARTIMRTICNTTIKKGMIMATLSASKARTNLYRLIDDASSSHEAILITGKRSNAVLVSEDDWKAIQETIYLLSVPGMRESIRQGLKTPIKECSKEPGW